MGSTQQCKKCGKVLPLDREHFGSQANGNFRGQCRKCVAARVKEWAKANPKRVAQREETRRELQRGFVITEEVKKKLFREQGKFCALCGEVITRLPDCDVDHLIPLAKGGTNKESNLVASHRQCNQEKHAKTLREYVAWRERNKMPRSTFDSLKIRQALTR